MNLNVVIIGDQFGFPEGTASTNYMRLLAIGLKEAGASVHVMPLYSDAIAASHGIACRGETEEGVTWEYASGTVSKPVSRIARLGMKFKADRNVARRLRVLRKEGRMDVLIYNGWSLDLLLEYRSICTKLKCPFVVQFLEWPAALPRSSFLHRLNNRWFCDKAFDMADATVVISSYLESLATVSNNNAGSTKPSCLIPILVDPKSMSDIHSKKKSRPYVLYCASMNAYFDDAVFVMESVAATNLGNIDLMMVGKASPITLRRITEKAFSLGIDGRIVIRSDYVPTSELFAIFKGAEALLAPLDSDVRSLARFPFKIGEYLLSGSPVVSCAVGEVRDYLVDGETAFLSKDNTQESFAKKIKEAVTSLDSRRVGAKGRALAVEQFGHIKHGHRFLAFLESLVSSAVL